MQISEHIGEIAIGAVVAVMGWFGKREIARLDKKADQEDVKGIAAAIEKHLADDAAKFDRINDVLSEVRENVARIAGRLDA